jgi:hypothetical protein
MNLALCTSYNPASHGVQVLGPKAHTHEIPDPRDYCIEQPAHGDESEEDTM